MSRAFFKALILFVSCIALAPACAFSMNKAPVSQEYLMVNMEQESWPVRSEDADFGHRPGNGKPWHGLDRNPVPARLV